MNKLTCCMNKSTCCMNKPTCVARQRYPRRACPHVHAIPRLSRNTGHWRLYHDHPPGPKFRVTCRHSRSKIFSSQALSADRFMDYQDTIQDIIPKSHEHQVQHKPLLFCLHIQTIIHENHSQPHRVIFTAHPWTKRYQDKFCSSDDHTCIAICSSEVPHICLHSSCSHLAFNNKLRINIKLSSHTYQNKKSA